ncbi:hypothetical protein [uncultured Bacteroides sp.]|uniref:hypothetical protein n=1 Tax=uncultured Bacteroides sp. TaxID=162156 RepID=UPI0025E7FA46|nr:hypothetical protein [uncultured Bacteroides sp.]
MKIKKVFQTSILVVFILTLFSCGNSNNNVKIDKSGVFGDIPQIILDGSEALNKISVKVEALNTDGNASEEKFGKLIKEYEEQENKMNQKLDEAIGKIKNVEVKGEVDEAFPFEIVGSPLLEKVAKGNPMAAIFAFKLKTTKEIPVKSNEYYNCYFKVVNKEGEVIDTWSATLLPLEEPNALGIPTRSIKEDRTYPAGQECNIVYSLSIKKEYEDREEMAKASSFDKFVFITEEEYNSLKK